MRSFSIIRVSSVGRRLSLRPFWLRQPAAYVLVIALAVAGVAFLQACGGISSSPGPGPGPAPDPPPPLAVLTYHNDNSRSGLNASETVLTPAKVSGDTFGKVFTYATDGYAVAAPLYLQGVTMPQGKRNVVFVATEHDSVYAFDADGKASGPLWKTSFINPAAGVTTVAQGDVGSTIFPEVGITSTPVIDAQAGTIYVEAMTKENGAFAQRLHALDITTGQERAGSPVTIGGSVPGHGDASAGGTLTFDPKLELQRPGLLLSNGKVYLAFGSHGDNGLYHGWVFAYDATSLQRVAIWAVTPDANAGAIWMGGDGLAADDAGNVWATTANGNFNADSGGRDYSDSIVKLAPDLSSVLDYFTPFDELHLATIDEDMGGGGVLLVSDPSGAHLAITTNKGGDVYLAHRDNLGHFHPGDNAQLAQFLPGALGTGAEDRCFTSPATWNNFVYFVGSFDKLRAFTLANGQLTPAAQSGATFGFQGASPVVSANGAKDGIVWTVDQTGNGILRAFDASDVSHELYNSADNGARDTFGAPVAHFIVPTVVNGRVYVAARGKLVAYGLLP